MVTEFEFRCPKDPRDDLACFTIFHAEHVVCHRHQLKYVFCGLPRTYPDDTPEAIAYWERRSASVAPYRSVPFPVATMLDYHCPEDNTGTLAHYNIRHAHHIVCHRHRLKYVYATMPRLSPHDPPEHIAYWKRLEAKLAEYQSVAFPIPEPEYSCPEDPTDTIDHINLFHSFYLLCHRHKLIQFEYDGGCRYRRGDTVEDIAYWKRLEAKLVYYRRADFPFRDKSE